MSNTAAEGYLRPFSADESAGEILRIEWAQVVQGLADADQLHRQAELVVDATTGQNGLQQARLFGEAVGVTGVVLTKLDGSARGGIAVAIAHELGLPVKLVGVGEALDDLRPFDPQDFARALVG